MQNFPQWFRFYPKKYISHFFIVISLLITGIGYIFPMFLSLFGLHNIPISSATLPFIAGQIVFFQFLHGGFMHVFLNSYFLYQAGPQIEAKMTRKNFIIFFITSTLFIAASLWFLTGGKLTIGISGFCMALLSYLYLDLKEMRHPYKEQILIMLVMNILLGFFGNISFVGHASGALFGLLWWYGIKKTKFLGRT